MKTYTLTEAQIAIFDETANFLRESHGELIVEEMTNQEEHDENCSYCRNLDSASGVLADIGYLDDH